MVTKLNVNIRTLLSNCEELAKDESNYWRLKKFIRSLDTMILELETYEDPDSMTKITEYKRRVHTLKVVTNYVESPRPAKTLNTNKPRDEDGEDAIREIRQLQLSKEQENLRNDLLSEDTVRRRKPEQTTENSTEAVQYYKDAQEKITEHMLSMTHNLKEQTETAYRIIKKDTEIIDKSAGMADKNMNSLQKETNKLEEHSRNAWKCWMWLMIVFVIVVFIGMVLFMKIMKKKKF